jgi:L-xylulose reductase
MNVTFAGKRVLVTGGANGLGRALVQKLYEDKAIVYTVDRDEAGLESLKSEFPNVITAVADLCDWKATRNAVESFGPVDHLVNNAGILINQEFLDLTEDAIDKQVNVNYKAMINITQVVAKAMIQNNIAGSIVNMSSIAAKVNVPGISVYSCTKATIVMLTKSMALELGPHNIRVNCICPTGIDTQLMRQLPPAAAVTIGRAVIKRPIEPSEAADLILFLLSDKAAMITGEDVVIDGGLSTN